MLDKENFKNLISLVLLAGLVVLAYFILKPIIFSIIYGVLLGYIFFPINKFLAKRIKSENLSAFLICLGTLLIICFSIVVVFTTFFKQAIDLYISIQKIDLVAEISKALPTFIMESQFSTNIITSLNTYLSDVLVNSLKVFTDLLMNAPVILLHLIMVFFVFFFTLRDGEKTVEYFKSISPLKKDIQEKFFKSFRDVTNSVLIGQVVVGIIQGLVAGIGYFIFGVPNAILLTLLTMVIGIIPIIGPWLVWIPVDIYLFVSGHSGAGIGLLIYGLFLVNWIDTFIRPVIVSRKTDINSGVVLIGMVGGLFAFGVIGLILGPLVLAYILLAVELYRKKTVGEDIIFKKVEEEKPSILKKLEQIKK
jgi:predicted PurR-regulated permease PerM